MAVGACFVLLREDPEHGGPAPPSRAAEALPEARYGARLPHLAYGRHGTDVDAQLEGGGAHRRGGKVLLLKALLEAPAKVRCKAAVVGEELVGDEIAAAEGGEGGGKLFGPGAAVGEEEVGIAPEEAVDVLNQFAGEARARPPVRPGRPVPPDLEQKLAALSLRGENPAGKGFLRAEGRRGLLHLPQGGAEGDPGDRPADEELYPPEEGLELASPLRAEEGVELVHDDVHQAGEGFAAPGGGVHEQGLQGFGGDEQNPPGVLPETVLSPLRGIPVPRGDGKAHGTAEAFQPPGLVVDEGLEGAHVEDGRSGKGRFRHAGAGGKEGGLRLAPGGGGTEDHVLLSVEDGQQGHLLDLPKGGPPLLPDPAADPFGQAAETGGGFHGCLRL